MSRVELIQNNTTSPFLPLVVLYVVLAQMPMAIFLPAYPMLSENFQVPMSTVNMLTISYLVLYGLSQPLFGYLAEKYDMRRIIIISLTMIVIRDLKLNNSP